MPGDTKFHEPYHRPASKKLVKPVEKAPVAPSGSTVVCQFQSPEGEIRGPSLNLPADVKPDQLALLLNNLLQNVRYLNCYLNGSNAASLQDDHAELLASRTNADQNDCNHRRTLFHTASL
jgi:hypothetical protein